MAVSRAAFKADVSVWAQRLRVEPQRVRLQAMTHKWASCSSGGIVSFSLDLLEQSASFREFVVAHELLHLRLPNHGRLFHATLQAWLKDNAWFARSVPAIERKTKRAGPFPDPPFI